jgi:hypothetical protein
MPGAHSLDDPTVPDEESLYIRIFASRGVVVGEGLNARPMSGALRQSDRDEALSVDLGSLCSPEETRDRVQGGPFHVVACTAAQARALGLGVRRDPVAEGADLNPAHGLVYGSRTDAVNKPTGGLTKGELAGLARVCRFRIVTPI